MLVVRGGGGRLGPLGPGVGSDPWDPAVGSGSSGSWDPSDAAAGAGWAPRDGAARAGSVPRDGAGVPGSAPRGEAEPPAVSRTVSLRVERGALAAGGSSSGSIRVSR